MELDVIKLLENAGPPPTEIPDGGGGGGGPHCWPCLIIAIGVIVASIGFVWLNFYMEGG